MIPATPVSAGLRRARRRCRIPGAFCLFWVGLLAGCQAALGQADFPPEGAITVERVVVGLDGRYKVGEWTALRLVARSSAPRSMSIEVEAPDADDNPTTFTSRMFDIPADEAFQIETCFRTGRVQADLRVRLIDGSGAALWQRTLRASSDFPPALRHETPLIVTFAALPDLRSVDRSGAKGEARAAPAAINESLFEPEVVLLTGFDELPASPRGLRSVDLMVIPTGAAAGRQTLLASLSENADAVLREWVRGGGHLLLSVTADHEAYRNSSLSEWAPVPVEGAGAVRQLLDLERFADANAPLRVAGSLRIARLGALPQRNVLVKEAGSPLIAAVPFGFGRVTTIGLDLESPPLSTWPALPIVLRKIFGGGSRQGFQQTHQTNRQLTQTGVSDLATQFLNAQESFPAVPRPSYWWVMALVVAYLIAIGPLDYLLVHRLLGRPELTWVTFAVLVSLGAGAAAWGAGRLNDRGLICNQLDLIDVDTASRAVRGRSWVSVYSPENRRYALSVQPTLPALASSEALAARGPDLALTWSGAPENSISGEYRAGGASLGGRPYRFAPDNALVENVPIPQWSTKTLCAAWSGETSENLIDCQVESAGAGQLSGTITHHFPAALEECLFVVGGWVYFPAGEKGSIAPDVPWQPGGPQSRARDLKALLTGERRTRRIRERSETEVLTTTVPYNPLGEDRSDILHMLSFHQVAGGREYTGLAHAALRELELTPLMTLGRGILLGRLPAPAARVEVDGRAPAQAEARTYVRLVVPVRHLDRAPAESLPKPEDQSAPRSAP